MRLWKAVYIFLCGIGAGIFIAYGLIVLARRTGWNYGGELWIMPLIFLLIYMGFMMGRMFPGKEQ